MLRILIADDSELVRDRVKELISGVDGTEVVGEAATGEETLVALEKLMPDVLILDIRMPGGNGIEALKAAKELDPAPTVIMLTAYAYPQYLEKCAAAGAEYFFDKATEFERVADALAELRQQGSEG
ncbi:MAG: response regulator transcription factor [Anaerolineae bacterium]|jgi:DNA-binding NarL/FixJ family response regulator